MHPKTLALSLLFLASLVSCQIPFAFFGDILTGLFRSGRYPNLIEKIPQDILGNLEGSPQDAGYFICRILHGDFPEAFADIAGQLVGDVESDFEALTNFVMATPTLAPVVLNDIEQGGEDVVSIVEELAVNPGAALTMFIDDVETVVQEVWGAIVTIGEDIVSEVEQIGGDILTDVECLFGDCPAAATTTAQAALMSNDQAAVVLSQSCQQILASPQAGAITAAPTGAVLTSLPTGLVIVSTESNGYVTTLPAASATASSTKGSKKSAAASGEEMKVLWLWMGPLGAVLGVMLML